MKLRGYWAARRARQETVVLALLAYRPEGWHVIDLRCYAGGWFVGVYATLERLEARGAVTSRWDERARIRAAAATSQYNRKGSRSMGVRETRVVRKAAHALLAAHLDELAKADPSAIVMHLFAEALRAQMPWLAHAVEATNQIKEVGEVRTELAHLLDVCKGAIEADWLDREGDLDPSQPCPDCTERFVPALMEAHRREAHGSEPLFAASTGG